MTELILNKLGIVKCPDIIEKATEVLLTFKEKQAQFLIRSSLGIARCYHHQEDDDAVQKSVSSSETFRAISTYEAFKAKLIGLCYDVERRLEKHLLGGKNITIGWKTTKFDIYNKSQMLHSFIWTADDLIKHSV